MEQFHNPLSKDLRNRLYHTSLAMSSDVRLSKMQSDLTDTAREWHEER